MPYPSTGLYPAATGLYPGAGPELVPTITTDAASGITTNSVVLSGTVNPNGLQTHYYFEYGLTAGYGSVAAIVNIGNGSSPVVVDDSLNGLLISGKTYHFRLVAYNGAGYAYGDDASFFTVYGVNDPHLSNHLHGAGRGQ